MKGAGGHKVPTSTSLVKSKTRKSRQFKSHNEHLSGVLEEYNPDNLPTTSRMTK